MRTRFVQMTQVGVKAYFEALKEQRREAAEFYRDHNEMTVGQVADKFHMTPVTMKKALDENGIEVDRERQYRSRKGRRITCPECGKIVLHTCKVKAAAMAREANEQREKIDPRRIHPVTGQIVERTPAYIAYMETLPDHTPASRTMTPEELAESSVLPGDTPEMAALARLGWEGIMERGRQELQLAASSRQQTGKQPVDNDET